MHSWRSSSFKLKFCSAYQDDLWFAPFLLSLKSPHTTKSVGSFRSPSFFFCSSCTSYMVEKTVSERTTRAWPLPTGFLPNTYPCGQPRPKRVKQRDIEPGVLPHRVRCLLLSLHSKIPHR